MPRPNAGESEQDFVSRYMGDAESRRKYKDPKQRSAIAYSIYREKKGVSKVHLNIGLDGEVALEIEKGGPGSGPHPGAGHRERIPNPYKQILRDIKDMKSSGHSANDINHHLEVHYGLDSKQRETFNPEINT